MPITFLIIQQTPNHFQRGDVSLLLDAQGLPDAKQAYTIPKEFSLVGLQNNKIL